MPPTPTEKKPIVLVVDANAEMRRFIEESLSDDYKLIVAHVGSMAWKKR